MMASPAELEYFLESARTLNFSRAAERIGITQPSLSVAIRRLEEAIGTSLFIRSKSGLTLTQAGRHLEIHAKKLIQMWDTIKSESLASHFEVQGSIRFGCHSSVALYTVPKFLPDLLNQYPKLDFQLKHDLSRKILEGIINLEMDIGIVVNPVRHPDLILSKLYTDKVSFFCNKHVSDVNKLIDSNETVITCDPDLIQTKSMLSKFKKKYSHRIISTSNLEVIAALSKFDNFIGILPETVAIASANNELKPIDKLPMHQDDIYLAYRHENRDIKAIKEINKIIKQNLKDRD